MPSREDYLALGVQTYGLPASLWVPIGAVSLEAIEMHVGTIVQRIEARGRVNAVLVAAPRPELEESVPLWRAADAANYIGRLHPPQQVWVHVDYTGYRHAWTRLGQDVLDPETFLDHVQNREAVRLRGYDYPFLRLCPVSRTVNTSGGAITGGEGLEKEHARSWSAEEHARRAAERAALGKPVVLADPMDLTKMLDVAPGTGVLEGVRVQQQLFYPS